MTVKLFFLFENFSYTNFAILQTKKQRYESESLNYCSYNPHRHSFICYKERGTFQLRKAEIIVAPRAMSL